MSSGDTLDALVSAGLVAVVAIGSPVSFRVEVVTSGRYASEHSWKIKNETNKVIAERNPPLAGAGSITYPLTGDDLGYTGTYTLETHDLYGDGWNGSWVMKVYSTDADGNETLRVTTEGPERFTDTDSLKTETLKVDDFALASPLTKATLSSMVTTSPGFNLQQIIQTGVVSSSDITTLFTTAEDYELLFSPSYGSNSIEDLVALGFSGVPSCFPAGTPVQTDQGVVVIDKLVPGEHTLRGKNIVAISQTRPLQKHIICFEKDSIGKNVPSQQTLCSKEHKVLYRGEMIKARDLADMCKNVKKVSYNGETLYNVLLEKHSKMLVNNMICETLHPENITAKFAKKSSNKTKL